MAKTRTPTNILELKGSFKINPNRKRPNEPVGETWDCNPPEYLTDKEIVCWHELIDLTPHGVLKRSDAITMEVTARLLSAFRHEPLDLRVVMRLGVQLAKLGLSPADRSAVTADIPHKNKFAED